MQPYSVRLLLFVNGGLKSESLCSYEDSPSYCTVLRLLQKDNIALLSLIIHSPDDCPNIYEEMEKAGLRKELDLRELDRKEFDKGILAGRIIGDRECFRLVPGCPLTETTYGFTLFDAEVAMLLFTEITRAGTHRMKTEEVLEASSALVKKEWEVAIKDLMQRQKAWNEAVRKVRGNECKDMLWPEEDIKTFEENIKTLKLNCHDIDTDWIIPEIDRRFKRVQAIIQTAKKVPCYALLDPVKYHNLVDALASDSEYEKEVTRQVAAQSMWIKEEPIFPPLV